MSWSLRVSVVERCPYHCAYCRPEDANRKDRRPALSADDYGVVAASLAGLGVEKVRFTGGEPLLRSDLADIVAAFRAHLPEADLALTTNGQLLARRLDALAAAGLRRATLHLDSLDPERYRAWMGDGDVGGVLDAALAARDRLAEVKINTVVQRGRNDDEIGAFLDLSRRTGLEVRFIELMNTGAAVGYVRDVFMSGREIVAAVAARVPVEPLARRSPHDPAALWRTADGVTFGVIASDTAPFCAACDRLRLSSGGELRGCLYQPDGVPLLPLLRRGDAAALREAVRAAMASKQSHHPALAPTKRRLPFSMASIGG